MYLKKKCTCFNAYKVKIPKLGRDVKSIVLKFPSDQTISLRIIDEKQGSSAGEIHIVL